MLLLLLRKSKGGLLYNMNKRFEFISEIEACGLIDLGHNGLHFTWCNQRDEENRVWKRLDRAMVNDKWLTTMPQTTITHLPSVGSDHSPLLMEMVVSRNKVLNISSSFTVGLIMYTSWIQSKNVGIDRFKAILCGFFIRK